MNGQSLQERFFSKVDVSGGPDACHEWRAAKNPKGYGRFAFGGRNALAHRVAWILARGPILAQSRDEQSLVLHKCDNPGCVNVNHLFLGSNQDNLDDMRGKGRYVNSKWSQTHCKHGHAFNESNTAVCKDGARRCRTCHAREGRAYRARMKEVAA